MAGLRTGLELEPPPPGVCRGAPLSRQCGATASQNWGSRRLTLGPTRGSVCEPCGGELQRFSAVFLPLPRF